eukprot:jgi/Undpi1/13969/HiC_scaffold_9.g03620.m1
MDERTAGIRQGAVRTFGRVQARLDDELTHDAYPSTSLRGQTLTAAPPQPGGVEEGRGRAGEEGQVGLREARRTGSVKGRNNGGWPEGGGGSVPRPRHFPAGKKMRRRNSTTTQAGGVMRTRTAGPRIQSLDRSSSRHRRRTHCCVPRDNG